MCVELFVPLVRAMPVAKHVGPALSVLRGAERHLGRWLVLAEVAVRAGDLTPLEEAQGRAVSGPSSSRASTWGARSSSSATERLGASITTWEEGPEPLEPASSSS